MDVVLVGAGDSVVKGFGSSKGRSFLELLERSSPLGKRSRGDLSTAYAELEVANEAMNGANSRHCLGMMTLRRPAKKRW